RSIAPRQSALASRPPWLAEPRSCLCKGLEVALLPKAHIVRKLLESAKLLGDAEKMYVLNVLNLFDQKCTRAKLLIAFPQGIAPTLKISDDGIAFHEHIPVFVFFKQMRLLLVERF